MIPIKILMVFFTEIEKSPKSKMESQKTMKSQSNFEKEES
jgi:hypothetical protein